MSIAADFLNYCCSNLPVAMYEAVGSAFVEMVEANAMPLFEGQKNPRAGARDIIQQYLVGRNGGDVDRVINAKIGQPEVTVLEFLEKVIHETIQRFGRTGNALRATLAQTASERVVTRVGGKLATAMLMFEPGISRIFLEDFHALRMMCGDNYDAVCNAVGIHHNVHDDIAETEKINRFMSEILPNVVMHNSLAYTANETHMSFKNKSFPNFPVMNGDFSYDDTKTKRHVVMGYDDLVALCSKMRDVRMPKMGDGDDSGSVSQSNVVVSEPGCKYDIFYIPSYQLLVKFCAQFTNPSIYIRTFSYWGGDDDHSCPWCLMNPCGWSSNVTDYGANRSVYVLLRKGWQNINTADLVGRSSSGVQTGDSDPKLVDADNSCICCIVRSNGTLDSACGRSDREMPSNRITSKAFAELIGVSNITNVMPYMGADGYKLDNWVQTAMASVGAVSGIAGNAPSAASKNDDTLDNIINLGLDGKDSRLTYKGYMFYKLSKHNIRKNDSICGLLLIDKYHPIIVYYGECDDNATYTYIVLVKYNGKYVVLNTTPIIYAEIVAQDEPGSKEYVAITYYQDGENKRRFIDPETLTDVDKSELNDLARWITVSGDDEFGPDDASERDAVATISYGGKDYKIDFSMQGNQEYVNSYNMPEHIENNVVRVYEHVLSNGTTSDTILVLYYDSTLEQLGAFVCSECDDINGTKYSTVSINGVTLYLCSVVNSKIVGAYAYDREMNTVAMVYRIADGRLFDGYVGYAVDSLHPMFRQPINTTNRGSRFVELASGNETKQIDINGNLRE